MLSLKSNLKKRLSSAKRVAILGLGSSLRGDDAAGLVLVEELKKNLRGKRKSRPLKIFSCGTTPESFTGEIKKFKPSHILIVDAVDMNKKAGGISIVDIQTESANVSFSTHSLPIKIFIDYLFHFLRCQFSVLGIQPKSIEFGSPRSAEVNAAIKKAAGLIIYSLQ